MHCFVGWQRKEKSGFAGAVFETPHHTQAQNA
jgi:hypothetical protein